MKRIGLLLIAAGCAHARTPDAYRADTADVLATQEADFKACYDKVLATTPAASGRVAVTFTVEAKTGHVTDPALDQSQTTAPDPVSQCVLQKLPQLQLARGDRKTGQAAWSWDFEAQPSPLATDAPSASASVAPATQAPASAPAQSLSAPTPVPVATPAPAPEPAAAPAVPPPPASSPATELMPQRAAPPMPSPTPAKPMKRR